ncbi:MAG: 50S ribosomal protein L18 [Bacteroidales bacterium]|nr:50S ribosomal protein L18 [Bacteroidales bacterium]
MAIKNRKQYRRLRIKQRIRKTLTGTPECPRLSVFRSNKEIYAQVIDDLNSKTLVSASSQSKELSEGTKIDQAAKVGMDVAKKALDAGIETIVFDRGGYLYHGRVKALAEAARKGGLKF